MKLYDGTIKEEEANKIIDNIKKTNDPMTAIQQLKEEGRQENQIEMVKNMLANGGTVEQICKLTGLSEDIVKQYK